MKLLRRTARLLDRILAILYYPFLVVACLSVMGCLLNVVLSCFGVQILGDQATLLLLGNLTLTLAPEAATVVPGWVPTVLSALGVVYLPVSCIMLLCVRDILKPFIQGTPFHETVARNLRTLGRLMLLNAVITIVMDRLLVYVSRLCDLEALLLGQKILRVTQTHTFDLMPLLFSGVLFLLAGIFRYGQELQTLSDETL